RFVFRLLIPSPFPGVAAPSQPAPECCSRLYRRPSVAPRERCWWPVSRLGRRRPRPERGQEALGIAPRRPRGRSGAPGEEAITEGCGWVAAHRAGNSKAPTLLPRRAEQMRWALADPVSFRCHQAPLDRPLTVGLVVDAPHSPGHVVSGDRVVAPSG